MRKEAWSARICGRVYATGMDKPTNDSQNRFAEVISKSQQVRQELNNKARKKQMEEAEPSVRDVETVEPEDETPEP